MDELIKKLESAECGSRECVLWPRTVDRWGRGRIWHGKKLMLAHRWVWERLNGPIPDDLLVCHHCDNPSCVNPAHLYLGTHADNMRDMTERKRYFAATDPERCREAGRKGGKMNTWFRGEDNPRAKLTEQQIEWIRRDPRATKYVAADYGVHRTTIQRIRSGKLWKN